MNVIVFGAGGKTGALVIERALASGHTVTAFLHDADHEVPAGVKVVTGDAADTNAVRKALAGQDAVIDAIGGKTPYKDTELERTAARNITDGMKSENVRRLIVVSMGGIGDSKEQTPFWYQHLLMPTFLRGATKDKTAMEAEVNASGLEFVIVRPPFLTEGAATGLVQVINHEGTAHKITRADLAAFLVDQLTSNQYVGQAVLIANS